MRLSRWRHLWRNLLPIRPSASGPNRTKTWVLSNHSVSFVFWKSPSEHGRATFRLLFCGPILSSPAIACLLQS
jgi:hypothetical protein